MPRPPCPFQGTPRRPAEPCDPPLPTWGSAAARSRPQRLRSRTQYRWRHFSADRAFARVRRQMQIGKQHLAGAKLFAFRGCGSLTLTIKSATAKTSSAVSTIFAPAILYASSVMPASAPRPVRLELGGRCRPVRGALEGRARRGTHGLNFLRNTDSHYVSARFSTVLDRALPFPTLLFPTLPIQCRRVAH